MRNLADFAKSLMNAFYPDHPMKRPGVDPLFAGMRWSSLLLGVCLAAGTCHARVVAQPPTPFDPAPVAAPPVSAPRPATAPLRASRPQVSPLRAEPAPEPAPSVSGDPTAPGPRLTAPDNAALQADVARLRTAATSSQAAGLRGLRAQGNACWVLGLLYVHGIGVVIDLAEAAAWFERAQALGEPLAAAGLAWCALEGCRAAPDPAAAKRWIAPLRTVNAPRAQYLQWLIDARLAPLQVASPAIPSGPAPSAPDLLSNRELLLRAAEAGDVQARIELGFESVAAGRNTEALDYFRTAAPRSAAAAANVALMTDRARGVEANEAGSATSAAETLARARRNHRGEGQPANFVEAIRLYRLAQNQGSLEAKKMLELIFSRPGANGSVDIAWMQELAFVNLSKDVLALDSTTLRRALRRDPTPLYDLIPPAWRRASAR
jgi:uncharacterized protein